MTTLGFSVALATDVSARLATMAAEANLMF